MDISHTRDQKGGRRLSAWTGVRSLLAIALCSAGLPLAALASEAAGSGPAITILSPQPGEVVTSTDIPVQVSTRNVDTSCKWVGLPPRAGQGHLHVLLDDANHLDTIPLINFYCGTATMTISGADLTPGPHMLMVALASNTHRILEGTVRWVHFTYQPTQPKRIPPGAQHRAGPRVSIVRPQHGERVNPWFSLELAAEGVVTSCDLLGKRHRAGFGHYAVSVARDRRRLAWPGSDGVPGLIAMSCSTVPIDLSAWPSGEYVVTVELLRNDHAPLVPPSQHSTTIVLDNPALPAALRRTTERAREPSRVSSRFRPGLLLVSGLALTTGCVALGRRVASRRE